MKEYKLMINGKSINEAVSSKLSFSEQQIIKNHYNLCGTLSCSMDKMQYDKIFGGLELFNSLLEAQRVTFEELSKKVLEYLNNKCLEYCKKYNISDTDFSLMSHYRSHIWEIYYSGNLVCGAKINCKIEDVNTGKTTITLELY